MDKKIIKNQYCCKKTTNVFFLQKYLHKKIKDV